MAKLLKLRRGTTTQHSSFTGAEGEVTVDTDKDTLVVHDGSTAGGHPVAAQDMDNVPAGAILGTQLENSGVTAGQYGSSSAIPIVTVDAQGLVTAASTTAIDSTTIANGTSSVAVANNGDITSTRSGNTRFTVNNSGASVTGSLGVSGAGSFGDSTITSAAPTLNFDDTNSTPDYRIINNSGSFEFQDKTNSYAARITINSDGHVDIPGNLDCGAGLDVTGNINATSQITAGNQITQDGTNDQKIVLSGSSDPYIRFKNGSTNAAYLQAHSNGNVYIVNETSGEQFYIGSGANGLNYYHDGTNSTVWHAGNDGAGSGLDADVLDGLSSTSFLRSDTADTASGDITFSGGAGAVTIAANSDIRFGSGTWSGEHVGKIQYHSNKFYLQATSGWQFRNAGGAAVMELDNNGTITGSNLGFNVDATFNGGSGAVTVGANSDIRLTSGNWTGNHPGKIQHHSNYLYIQGGTSGFIFMDDAGNGNAVIDSDGHFKPNTTNTFDLGSSSLRWRNLYTQDLQLSNEAVGDNGIDGTWGNYTIVEGESDLFLKNNRSGKTFKFNLTEVS